MPSIIARGTTIGHYTLLEKLGEGGMGVVYKARDTTLDRPVALKFLPAHLVQDQAARERFIQEARAASSLDHPNICTIHEISEAEDGQMFICMAFCDGQSLADLLRQAALPLPRAIDIAVQIARGLDRAHSKGIIHRDIKPGNIVLSSDGTARIVDFGLAKLAGQVRLTTTGSISGTSQYMSPEQIRGEELDGRTDIWSLGVVLYEMLTGSLPFPAEYREAAMYEILQDTPRPIRDVQPALTSDLEAVVHRCLMKEKARRYQTAGELLADLDHIQKGLPLPADRRHPGERRARRALAGQAAVAVVAVMAVAGAVILFIPSLRTWVGSPLPERRVIAVLPFTPVGGRMEDQNFCCGMVEVLTAKLTEVKNFQGPFGVISSREVMGRRVETPSEALRLLGATLAITGSYQREGSQVRIAATLVDTRTLENVRSSTVDDDIQSGPGLQDRVLREVVEMLGMDLQPATTRAVASEGSSNPHAYDFSLQAKGMLRRGNDPALTDAATYLCRQAILLDSTLMDAYEVFAAALVSRGAVASAESVLHLACRRKPDSWTGHSNLGVFYFRRGRYAEAEREFRECIRLAPQLVRGYNNLGGVLFMQERWEEACLAFEQSLAVTPNATGYSNLGTLLFYQEQDYAGSARLFQKALAINDVDYRLWFNLASAYYWSPGEREKSMAPYRRAAQLAEEQRHLAPRNPDLACYLAACYAILGNRDSALSLIRHAHAMSPITADVLERIAEVYALLHMPEDALRTLDSAMQAGGASVTIRRNPVFGELRADTRFDELLRRHREGSPH